MSTSRQLLKFLVAIMATGISVSAMAAGLYTSAPSSYQAPSVLPALQDIDEQEGPFAIGNQNYVVLVHVKQFPAARDPLLARTLAGLEIRDAAGNLVYENSFPLAAGAGSFLQGISVSVERVAGKTGAGLLMHYRRWAPDAQTGRMQAGESWQIFGLINDKLTLLGKPKTIGEQGAGGPFMGVMMRAANGMVSVINQPDTMEIRTWTGNFYVFVPLRVDWSHGGLAQGQRCVERLATPLEDVGCPMRVDANRKVSAEEFRFVRLFAEAHENFGTPEHVVIQKVSKVEILGGSAITAWNERDGLTQPTFSDVWLHVRIDNREGWIHGEDDLAAVGLPAGNPTP